MPKKKDKPEKPVPQWKLDLRAKAGFLPKILTDPPWILDDPAPRLWECECDDNFGCMCCPFGDWPECKGCGQFPRKGVEFYKSNHPDKMIYYCVSCFNKECGR